MQRLAIATLTVLILASGLIHAQMSEPVQLTLPDNVDFNAKVGDLTLLDPSLPAPDPTLGYQTAALTAENPRLEGYFAVDRQGAIFARRNVDRDELCSAAGCCESAKCQLDFGVTLTTVGHEARRRLRVVLLDENDKRPAFPSLAPLELPEDAIAPGPTGLRLTPAEDGDGPGNRVRNYSLADPSGTFGLDVVVERLLNGSGTQQVPVPYLTLLRPLDRELVPQYQVTLVATDGVHAASAVVTIRVGDVNDNAPVFDRELTEPSFPETKTVGDKIRALTATDGDSGANANVTFAIASVKPPSLAEHFRVGSESGLWGLFLARELDFESPEQRSAEVLVVARDQGSPPRSSTGTVRISVTDANDNAPVITELYSYNLEEHQPARVLVKTLQVTDADQMSVGRVDCRIESNNMFRLELNGSGAKSGAQSERLTYSLLSATSFDYEMTQEEKVSVSCIDNASPEKVTRKLYQVPIRETNDFGPVFQQRNYHVSVPEDLANGLTVQTVRATDQDRGRFGDVHYELDSAGAANFSVDSRSGRIEVRGRLDRETAESLRFTVVAKDYGDKSDTATVVVVLTDVNDCAPQYTGPPGFHVVENAPPGTVLGRVTFRDPDSGVNGTVTFAMLSDTHNVANEFLHLFSNGSLVVAKPIDREAYAKFYVEIEARDGGRISRSATATVQVDVADVNDCAPALEQPPPGSLVGSERTIVYTNLPPGSPILAVRAIDRDLGDNGTVEYRLGASNASGLLSIGLETGRLASAWDPETAPPAPGVYTVVVLMRDRGLPRQLTGRGEFRLRLTPPPGGGPLGRLGSAGVNGLVALVAIVAGTVVLASGLLVAICRVRAGSRGGGGGGGARRRQLATSTVIGVDDEEAGLKAAAAAAAAASTVTGQESSASSTYYAWQHPGSPLGSLLRDGAEKQVYRPVFIPDCGTSLLLPLDQMGTACVRQHGCTSPRPGLQVYPSHTDMPVGRQYQHQHQQQHLLHQPQHERRRSDEEDAPSVHDSGRGGSVEDVKATHQHHQSHPPMGTFTVPASAVSRSTPGSSSGGAGGSGGSGRRLVRPPDTTASAGTMI